VDDDMTVKPPEGATETSAAAPTPEPAPADASGDWAEVADALNTLGASISRATKAAVDNEENRRRLRELSEGLATLARHAGASIETAAATPEGGQVQKVVVQAAETVREAGDKAVETVREAGDKAAEQLRPHVLSAVQAANEKFRKAAEQWEVPEKPTPEAEGPTTVEATPSSAASDVLGETPASEASAPQAPSAPEFSPIPVGRLEAIKIAHERFVAERKAAEEAATASKAAAGTADEVPTECGAHGPEPERDGARPGGAARGGVWWRGRCPTATRSCAAPCARKSPSCVRATGSRSCTSRTIRQKRCRWRRWWR